MFFTRAAPGNNCRSIQTLIICPPRRELSLWRDAEIKSWFIIVSATWLIRSPRQEVKNWGIEDEIPGCIRTRKCNSLTWGSFSEACIYTRQHHRYKVAPSVQQYDWTNTADLIFPSQMQPKHNLLLILRKTLYILFLPSNRNPAETRLWMEEFGGLMVLYLREGIMYILKLKVILYKCFKKLR